MEGTLRAIGSRASPGSILGFDFQHMDSAHELIDTKLRDEQIKFGIDADSCEGYLSGYGFQVRERVDAQAMESRYLRQSDGTLFGHIHPMMHIVTAILT